MSKLDEHYGIPKSVTGPKKNHPKVEGELPPLQHFEVSFYMDGKSKIGSVTIQARDETDAITIAGQSLKIIVKKSYAR